MSSGFWSSKSYLVNGLLAREEVFENGVDSDQLLIIYFDIKLVHSIHNSGMCVLWIMGRMRWSRAMGGGGGGGGERRYVLLGRCLFYWARGCHDIAGPKQAHLKVV